jgi:tRNA (adenine22-N1)-methyltransferase
LRPRLGVAAALVPPGCVAADIGSDHALLPVYLVRQGICPRVIAADIAEGPLQNGLEAVRAAGLEGKIELRLSNGFQAFSPEDARCWILAGMGGTLMARLLGAAPWLCRPGTVLVAQPMRRAHELRAWLIANRFRIERECACRDAGRVYVALRAEYTGESYACPPGYAYYGELPRCGHPAARELLERGKAQLRVRMEALRQSGQSVAELAALEEIYDDYRARCI